MKRRKQQHRRRLPIVRHRKKVKRDVVARKLKQEERETRGDVGKRSYTPKHVIDSVRRFHPKWPAAKVYATARARHESHLRTLSAESRLRATVPAAGRITFTVMGGGGGGGGSTVPKIVPRETVNHPDHYGGEANPYEAIKVIEAWGLGFALGNAVKYINRAGKKGSELEDLEKSRWYLDREIANLKKREAAL